MPTKLKSLSLSPDDPLLRRLGITRVARVTGLDRAGVEVACAVRPQGHILQVCQGKGMTFEAAAWSAIGEAAELWSAEQVAPLSLRYGSWKDFRRANVPAIPASALGEVNALWSEDTWMAWEEGVDFLADHSVWVPAHAVRCLPAGAPYLGPATLRWTSNGMGAHVDSERAVTHALLEAAERHLLSLSLPDGWTPASIRKRRVDWKSDLSQRLEERGFEVYVFDLTPENGIGWPVAGAMMVDRDEGPIPLTAGYACRVTADQAVDAAILEAAQSRLTDIHGAREDIVTGSITSNESLMTLRSWLRKSKPSRQFARGRRKANVQVTGLLRELKYAGVEQVVGIPMVRENVGLHIWKVLIPGWSVSELLQ